MAGVRRRIDEVSLGGSIEGSSQGSDPGGLLRAPQFVRLEEDDDPPGVDEDDSDNPDRTRRIRQPQQPHVEGRAYFNALRNHIATRSDGPIQEEGARPNRGLVQGPWFNRNVVGTPSFP